jgi:hypothetical protein
MAEAHTAAASGPLTAGVKGRHRAFGHGSQLKKSAIRHRIATFGPAAACVNGSISLSALNAAPANYPVFGETCLPLP